MPDALRPLFDQVVIKELEPERMRKSGLLVPQGTHDLPPNEGIVLAAGDGPPDLPDFKMPVRPGDHVVFPRSAGRLGRGGGRAPARLPRPGDPGRHRVGSHAGGDLTDVPIRGEMIRLGQLLKLAGVVGAGGEAKALLASEPVLVNGEPEGRRGRQLHPGDEVRVAGEVLRVVGEAAP